MQVFISFTVNMFFLIIFHTLRQCDVENVVADDVWGRECDVVVTMSGEADCSLGTQQNQQFPTPWYFLPPVFYFDSFNLFFYLHQSIYSSLLWILLLFSVGFYWFLHSLYCCTVSTVGLVCELHEPGSWETGLFVGWLMIWILIRLECRDMEIEREVLKFP